MSYDILSKLTGQMSTFLSTACFSDEIISLLRNTQA